MAHPRPAVPCPSCGRINNAATIAAKSTLIEALSDVPPVPGDVSVCIGCGAVAIFTDLGVRPPSADELAEALSDPVTAAVVRSVRGIE